MSTFPRVNGIKAPFIYNTFMAEDRNVEGTAWWYDITEADVLEAERICKEGLEKGYLKPGKRGGVNYEKSEGWPDL